MEENDPRYQRHLAEREAQEYASTRRWHPRPNEPAMRGETALAKFLGAEQDTRNRPGGDGGREIWGLFQFRNTESWYELDVKATSTGKLIVNAKKVKRHCIYVMGADLGDRVKLLGWEWGHFMQLEPIQYQWCGNDADVHLKKAELLRSMSELKAAYRGRWRHHGLRERFAFYPKEEIKTWII